MALGHPIRIKLCVRVRCICLCVCVCLSLFVWEILMRKEREWLLIADAAGQRCGLSFSELHTSTRLREGKNTSQLSLKLCVFTAESWKQLPLYVSAVIFRSWWQKNERTVCREKIYHRQQKLWVTHRCTVLSVDCFTCRHLHFIFPMHHQYLCLLQVKHDSCILWGCQGTYMFGSPNIHLSRDSLLVWKDILLFEDVI